MKFTVTNVKAFFNGRMTWINLQRPPKSHAELTSAMNALGMSNPFSRRYGHWYKLVRDEYDKNNCKWLYVDRALYMMTIWEWIKVAMNNDFRGNHRQRINYKELV